MQPPFDFVHALEMHSGLTGWKLVTGNPEAWLPGIPIVFEYDADPQFIQKASFTIDRDPCGGTDMVVNMSMNDSPRIMGLNLDYAKILYARDPE